MERRIIGIREKLPFFESLPLSLQHLTAMFGATILVPGLLGIDPAIALLMNGAGTLLYAWITKGGIPAYLGSSFAFIAPSLLIISSYGGFNHAQSGFIFFGIFFVIVSLIVRYRGIRWIDVAMPPAVMGAVVAIIGLELAPVAARQAGLILPAEGNLSGNLPSSQKVMLVSMFTLFTGIFGSLLFRGFMQAIPVLVAIVAGYLLALAKGMVDTSLISQAPWFALPEMHAPVFDLNAVFIIFPACIVVLAEHISHLVVTGKITGSDLVRDPGLHRSLLADGISNILSGMAGSPPNTTYGENIGVMAITRVYSVWVIRGAAILAIVFSCIGKISATISSIPTPVIGGISLLLYGVIAVQGIRIFVEQKVDFSLNKNMILGAATFIAGISGASVRIGSVSLKGMALAAVTGVVLSTLLYLLEKSGMIREKNSSDCVQALQSGQEIPRKSA